MDCGERLQALSMAGGLWLRQEFAEKHGSSKSKLSELWRRDFVRRVSMSLLRVQAGHHCLPLLLRPHVHRQQTLSALRRCRHAGNTSATVGVEMSALQGRHVFGHHWCGGDARV